MSKELNILKRIMLAVSRGGDVKIFRNNVGTGWVGKSKMFSSPATVKVNAGDVLVQAARPLKAGLCEGSSDLIGWKSVIITPEMVGQTVAQFVAIEVKTNTGKASEKQINFINAVNRDGGIGKIMRSDNDKL